MSKKFGRTAELRWSGGRVHSRPGYIRHCVMRASFSEMPASHCPRLPSCLLQQFGRGASATSAVPDCTPTPLCLTCPRSFEYPFQQMAKKRVFVFSGCPCIFALLNELKTTIILIGKLIIWVELSKFSVVLIFRVCTGRPHGVLGRY